MPEFTGPGAPLTAEGLDAARAGLDVPLAALWSVLAVETSGSGYQADRRPKILFERHIFSRLTSHRFDADDPDVSAPTPGGYGPGGAHQYLRLEAAIQLDRDAALQSASWGLGQVMGENHRAAGFDNAGQMVDAFVGSEDAQILGMARFIKACGMDAALAKLDWTSFARRYNGPHYAANHYDEHLKAHYQRFLNGPPPDLTVRAAQTYLLYRGYDLVVDGVLARVTTDAVKAFQTKIGLKPTGVIDEALITRLRPDEGAPEKGSDA